VGRFGTDDKELRVVSSKMLTATYFLLQGTPFIYQGQEIGMTNGDFDTIDDVVDIEAHNVYKLGQSLPILKPMLKKTLMSCNRDNARTPVQWDDSIYAGFSTVKPWLKVNKNKSYINAASAIKDPDSTYNFFKKIIEFRKGNEVIRDGEYIDLLPKDNKVFAYARNLGSKEVVVISNFTNRRIKCNTLSKYNKCNLVLTNYAEKEEDYLNPYETRVLINY